MLHLVLLSAVTARPEAAALDSALFSSGDVAPECTLSSTEPLSPAGASPVPRADAEIRQVLDCGGDVAVIDFFDETSDVARGIRDLTRSKWGGAKPPKRPHDALLRKDKILADVFGSRAATAIVEIKLRGIGFEPLAKAKALPEIPPLDPEDEPIAPAMPSAPAEEGAIAWESYDSGLRRASIEHKPVCLVFTTGWCPHCKNYERVLADPRVVAKSKSFVMVKVDEDHPGDVPDRYAPDGRYVPRTLFLSSDGDLDKSLVAHRGSSKYVYSDTEPSSLLAGMDRALGKLGR